MLERPNTQFAIYRSPTVGDNRAGGISAMQLPGTRIRGVIVDNPSGSWVKLSGAGLGFEPYIAPYTLAWSVSVLPSVLEIAAAYVAGPTGQPASTVGSPIVIYLFEAQVPSSGGSQFVIPAPTTILPITQTVVGRFQPGADVQTEWEATLAATNTLRLFSVALGFNYSSVGAAYAWDTSVQVVLHPRLGGNPVTVNLATVSLTPEAPQQEITFAGGIDLPIGQHLSAHARTLFGQAPVAVTPIYAIV